MPKTVIDQAEAVSRGIPATRHPSLLPEQAHERLLAMMLSGVTGSFTLHLQEGAIRVYEVRETASVALQAR